MEIRGVYCAAATPVMADGEPNIEDLPTMPNSSLPMAALALLFWEQPARPIHFPFQSAKNFWNLQLMRASDPTN